MPRLLPWCHDAMLAFDAWCLLMPLYIRRRRPTDYISSYCRDAWYVDIRARHLITFFIDAATTLRRAATLMSARYCCCAIRLSGDADPFHAWCAIRYAMMISRHAPLLCHCLFVTPLFAAEHWRCRRTAIYAACHYAATMLMTILIYISAARCCYYCRHHATPRCYDTPRRYDIFAHWCRHAAVSCRSFTYLRCMTLPPKYHTAAVTITVYHLRYRHLNMIRRHDTPRWRRHAASRAFFVIFNATGVRTYYRHLRHILFADVTRLTYRRSDTFWWPLGYFFFRCLIYTYTIEPAPSVGYFDARHIHWLPLRLLCRWYAYDYRYLIFDIFTLPLLRWRRLSAELPLARHTLMSVIFENKTACHVAAISPNAYAMLVRWWCAIPSAMPPRADWWVRRYANIAYDAAVHVDTVHERHISAAIRARGALRYLGVCLQQHFQTWSTIYVAVPLMLFLRCFRCWWTTLLMLMPAPPPCLIYSCRHTATLITFYFTPSLLFDAFRW